LRVFGVVDVVPDLSDSASPVVPVTITLTEARARELRAGPLFQIEPGKAILAAHAQWRDDNVIDRLWRMEQETEVGVGTLLPEVSPTELRAEDVQIKPVPVVDVHGRVEIPQLLGPTWSLVNEGQVEVGFETGYRYFTTSFSPSLAYNGIEHFVFSGGYRIQYTDYFDRTINLRDIEDSPLGLDLKDPYLLSLLEQRLLYDGRDSPLSATTGSYWSFALGEAGGPFGGDFQFFRVIGEGRTYRSLPDIGAWDPGLTFAGRLGWGVILPYGKGAEASVPYAERLYLGGANSVRGWGPDRLGPYVCDDGQEGFGVTRDSSTCARKFDLQVPAGGNLSLMGSLEVRKSLLFGVSLALFSDVGQVWDTPEDFDYRELQVSVGAGLRYATLIGPIRADLAWRAYAPPYFDDPNYFVAHPGLAVYLALGEAF
jgi:translocation and assembly module TamA